MTFTTLLNSLGVAQPAQSRTTALTAYSALPAMPTDQLERASSSMESSTPTTPLDEIHNDLLHPSGLTLPSSASRRQKHKNDEIERKRWQPSVALPTMARFLADFTLGFADGLTVPFALTAGLSSLGQTETVIYAGMAEINRPEINMGVGGYLSARGEAAAGTTSAEQEDEDTSDAGDEEEAFLDREKYEGTNIVESYLEPLDLPDNLKDMVLAHIAGRNDIHVALKDTRNDADREKRAAFSPFMVGLSVSLGYLVGGLLPLFPYFFVYEVDNGLKWSFAVCVVALFVFGFSKDFALSQASEGCVVSTKGPKARSMKATRLRWWWRRVRHSTWEGVQMVILGSVAAGAALLCVRMFEGIQVSS